MVEKFNNILRQIQNDKGIVTLFMILRMEEVTDKWSVILSAPWANDEDKDEIFLYIRTLLINHLDQNELLSIARIGLLKGDDKIVRAVTNNISVQNGSVQLKNTYLDGLKIFDAYVFQSTRLQNTLINH